MKTIYKIVFFDIYDKVHTITFNARTKEEANKIWQREKELHEAYKPKVKQILWSGTLEEWENLKLKRNETNKSKTNLTNLY